MLAFVGKVIYFYEFEAIAITHFDLMPKLKIINFNEKVCGYRTKEKCTYVVRNI